MLGQWCRTVDSGLGNRLGDQAPVSAVRSESPYLGLAPFTLDRADVFYGRERMTAELEHTGLERDARAGRGLVEYERHAAALERARAEPVRLQLDGAPEQPQLLVRAELLTC